MSAFISNVLDSSAGLWTWSGAVGLALVAGIGVAPPASAQDWDDDYRYETEEDYAYGYADDGYPELVTRVWFDRGDEPLLERGDRVRVYYHASEDAFVALFHIDTNGTLRLLFPRSPEENHYVRGGRDYRLVFPTASSWRVSDDPGVGYYFSVASPEPFDFRDFRFSHYGGGWDLTEIGRRVYSDPYVAMDEVVARLIPDWDVVPYALDFATYHVERRYEYPRFLCYDCHGFRPYASWNPYIASCTSFRVVVYDDPYFYPATRYVGTRVVYTRPVRVGLPRFEFKERARGEAAAPLVIERSARPTSGGTPGVSGRSAVPRTGPARLDGRRPVRTRPSEVLPGRTPSPTVRRGGSSTRPTLERRPPAASPPGARGGATVRPPTRSSGGGAVRPPTRSSGGSAARPPTRSSGGGAVRPPTRSSGGAAARPPTRSSGGAAARPPTRSSGGGAVRTPARPPTRSSGGGAVRPPTRSSGGAAARPPTRSSGGSAARSPTRSSGGAAARPPTRSSGGSTARPTRPPRRGGGGG